MSKSPIQIQQLDQSVSASAGSFVNLSKVAAPYTTVVKRAQCTDFSQDLMPRFGVERVMIQSIQEIQGETGPNGERVFKPMNDQHDAIRMVGGWFSSNSASGQSCYTDVLGSYAEITFYGTGLNLLTYTDVAARDISVSIDGVAQSNILNIGSGILGGRNYSMNRVINIASNLSLGLHTVKVGIVNGTFLIFGYEVLNTNSTIQLTPGTSYAGGRRLYAPSLTTSAYNSSFTNTYGTAGTKGGCVLVYQKADGTIAKDIRYTETSAAYMGSASHTNEEVIRTYHWREFGCGRISSTDDFSSLTTTTGTRAFTLDDGITTLAGLNVQSILTGSNDTLAFASTGDHAIFTFVGTGLDLVLATTDTSRTITVTIDGSTVATASAVPYSGIFTTKICSGLPYGTHTVKITATANPVRINSFVVYAPTVPTLPSGAVSLGQYYLMADYVADTTYGNPFRVSTGVLRKMFTREVIYSGTWTVASNDVQSFASGFNIRSSTAASYYEITFVGTGLNLRPFLSDAAYNITFSLDGAAPGTSTFAYTGSGLTYTPGTGVLSGTLSGGGGTGAVGLLSITGLTFGVHKLRVTLNSTSAFMYSECIDVITPVHAPVFNGPGVMQNTLSVGSCAIMDKRKFSEQQVAPVKAWAQTAAVSSGPSTALTTFVPLADLSTTVYASTDKTFSIQAQAALVHGTIDGQSSLQIFVNGAAVSVDSMTEQAVAGRYYWHSVSCIVRLPAGQHKIDCYFRSRTAGTTTSGLLNRSMTVQEL